MLIISLKVFAVTGKKVECGPEAPNHRDGPSCSISFLLFTGNSKPPSC